MAQYGLETETTTHIKGMQMVDSQSDMGGGNSFPTPLNSTFLFREWASACISYKDGTIYVSGYKLNETLKGEIAVPAGTSVYFPDKAGSFASQYITDNRLIFVDEIPEDAEVLSKYGMFAFIQYPM